MLSFKRSFLAETLLGIPISLGLLFDNEVTDFLAPGHGYTQHFDLIDALDLLGVGLDRTSSFSKSCLCSSRRGGSFFFEWVAVPVV
jgi:hypothetical protein